MELSRIIVKLQSPSHNDIEYWITIMMMMSQGTIIRLEK